MNAHLCPPRCVKSCASGMSRKQKQRPEKLGFARVCFLKAKFFTQNKKASEMHPFLEELIPLKRVHAHFANFDGQSIEPTSLPPSLSLIAIRCAASSPISDAIWMITGGLPTSPYMISRKDTATSARGLTAISSKTPASGSRTAKTFITIVQRSHLAGESVGVTNCI